MYNLNPAKFGLASDNLVTHASNYGDQVEYWHGVDVNIAMRRIPGLHAPGRHEHRPHGDRTTATFCAKVPEPARIARHLGPHHRRPT